MKNIKRLSLLLSAIALTTVSMLAVSCDNDDDDEEQNQDPIEVVNTASLTQTVEAEATTGESTVVFKTTRRWTSKVEPSGEEGAWLSITPDEGAAGEHEVTVNLTPNDTPEERLGKVIITCGGMNVTISVTQKANEGNRLLLIPSKASILPDGTDEVTFTVIMSEEPETVLTDARVYNITSEEYLEPVGGVISFTTTEEGAYEFRAERNDLTSASVRIWAGDVPVPTGAFLRNVALFRYSADWCEPCYNYAQSLKYAMEDLEKANGRSGVVHVVTHVSSLTTPSLNYAGYQEWWNYFKLGISLPEGNYDFRESFKKAPGRSDIVKSINDIITAHPATTGFYGVGLLEENSAVVNVSVYASKADNYNLGVLLIENNIVAYQAIGGNDYVHNRILRQALAPIEGTPLGSMAAGDFVTKTFDIDLTGYVGENCQLMVYTTHVVDGKCVVNNTAYIDLDGITEYETAQ